VRQLTRASGRTSGITVTQNELSASGTVTDLVNFARDNPPGDVPRRHGSTLGVLRT